MRAIFVQIKCEMGQAYKVAREAADTIEQMSELYSTSGQYDLLGKFYLEPEQDIGLFVTEKIQTLPGVKDTYTLITFNAFGGGRGSLGLTGNLCDHLARWVSLRSTHPASCRTRVAVGWVERSETIAP